MTRMRYIEHEERTGLMLIWITTGYLAWINLIAICVTLWDKRAARRHYKRIPESVLLLLGLIGGRPGMHLAMKAKRHKTLHKKFMIGLPIILTLQILLSVVIWIHRHIS